MTYYHRLGNVPHKRHTQFRKADGSLHHEEVLGIHGFAGIQSILYHLHPPTRVRSLEDVAQVEPTLGKPAHCGIATCARQGFRRAQVAMPQWAGIATCARQGFRRAAMRSKGGCR